MWRLKAAQHEFLTDNEADMLAFIRENSDWSIKIKRIEIYKPIRPSDSPEVPFNAETGKPERVKFVAPIPLNRSGETE